MIGLKGNPRGPIQGGEVATQSPGSRPLRAHGTSTGRPLNVCGMQAGRPSRRPIPLGGVSQAGHGRRARSIRAMLCWRLHPPARRGGTPSRQARMCTRRRGRMSRGPWPEGRAPAANPGLTLANEARPGKGSLGASLAGSSQHIDRGCPGRPQRRRQGSFRVASVPTP